MSGFGIGTTSTPVPTQPVDPGGYWIPDPNYMGDSSPPMVWVSDAPAPAPTPVAVPAPAPAPAPAPTSSGIFGPNATTGGAGSTTPIYTGATDIPFLQRVREQAAQMQAAGTLDAAVTANAGGTWQPNPHYTGDASPPMMWVPNPSPVPTAPGAAAAPPAPPQLPNPAPTAADFANRSSPELAQMQTSVQQTGLAPIPFAQRGMQNGLFAGASGGLPDASQQQPTMNPVQLMQLLAQSGLMGGT